jgi:hypothetical protein
MTHLYASYVRNMANMRYFVITGLPGNFGTSGFINQIACLHEYLRRAPMLPKHMHYRLRRRSKAPCILKLGTGKSSGVSFKFRQFDPG